MVSSSNEVTTESADYVRETPAVKKKVQFALRYKDGKIVTEEGSVDVVSGESVTCDPSEKSDDASEKSDASEGGDVSEDGDVGEESDASDESDSCEGGDPGAEYGSDLESDVSDQESNEETEKVNQSIIRRHSQAHIKKMKELASKELPFTFPGQCMIIGHTLNLCLFLQYPKPWRSCKLLCTIGGYIVMYSFTWFHAHYNNGFFH